MTTEEAKQRIQLEEILSHYGVDLQNGKALCPFHEENEPSFTVKGERYRCFGCGESGDIYDFVCKSEGLDFSEAKKLIFERYGFEFSISEQEIEGRKLSDALHRYCQYYSKKLGEKPEVWAFLVGRGFPVNFVNEKLIGFIPKGDQYRPPKEDLQKLVDVGIIWGSNGRHMMSDTDRIIFPWFHYGRIVYLSARRLDDVNEKRYKNLSFPPPTINLPAGPELWVTEGVTDTFRAEAEGLKACGVPGNGLQTIKLPNSVKSVNLAFDSDNAGAKYIERFGVDFFSQGKDVRVVRFPREKMDFSDFFTEGGTIDDLERIPLIEYFIYRLKEDRKYWKPIVYRMLRDCDEFDRSDFFKLIKSVTGYSIAVIKKDFENESKELDREDVFKIGDTEYIQPDGYTVTKNGILFFNQKGVEKITPQLVYVKNIGQDNIYQKQFVLLKFNTNNNGKSREIVYRKSQISNTRELIGLSDDGLDVHSYNVANLSKFLVDFVNCNYPVYDTLGILDIVTQLGWHGRKFILPNQAVSEKGVSKVYYYENDVRRVGFRKCGTLDGWVSAIKSLHKLDDPSFVIFLLYAGFAGSILEKLGKKSLIIHMFGDSRDGKTVSMMFPASIYGYPDIHDGVFIRWKNTENFIIRQLEQRKNIPFFLDELSSELKLDIQSLVYQFEGGISKGKASKSNALRTEIQRTWSTTIFSTGEPSFLKENSLTGAMVRTWEFPGIPFREKNLPYVNYVKEALKENCGHAIEPFLKAFFNFEWEKIGLFYDSDNMSRIEASIRDQMQSVYIAGIIAEEIFNFGFDPKIIVNNIFDELAKDKKEDGNIIDRFLHFLKDFYSINKAFFLKVSQGKTEAISSDFDIQDSFERQKLRSRCFGYVFNKYDLGIVRSQFNQIVQEFGVGNTSRMILKKLKDNELISTTKERNIRIRKVIEGESVELIYFPGFLRDLDVGDVDKDFFDDDNDPF